MSLVVVPVGISHGAQEWEARYQLGEENLVVMQCREICLSLLRELLDRPGPWPGIPHPPSPCLTLPTPSSLGWRPRPWREYIHHTVRAIMVEFMRCTARFSGRADLEAARDGLFAHMMAFIGVRTGLVHWRL